MITLHDMNDDIRWRDGYISSLLLGLTFMTLVLGLRQVYVQDWLPVAMYLVGLLLLALNSLLIVRRLLELRRLHRRMREPDGFILWMCVVTTTSAFTTLGVAWLL